MASVAQERKITQSPPAIEIDGVLYRQCGEGRKHRRANSVDGCGDIIRVDDFPVNNWYSDGHSLLCPKCTDEKDARYAARFNAAIVPIKVDENVPIGGSGTCRGVWIEEGDKQVPCLVIAEACRYWGLNIQGQVDRIQAEPSLSAGLRVVKTPTLRSGYQPSYALRYDLVPLWFTGIETSKMRKKERAAQLVAYQKTCGQVLTDYFFGTQTAPPPPAQRIEPEGTLAEYGDGPILSYLDLAMSRTATTIELTIDRAAAQLESRLRPILESIRVVNTETFIEGPPRLVRGEMYFETLNSRLMLVALDEGEAADWANVGNLADLLKRDWHCLIMGMTMRGEKTRQKEHTGKNRIGKSHSLRTPITTDNPGKLNELFITRRHGLATAVPGTKDLFVAHASVLDLIKKLPPHMTIEDATWHLSGWNWK